MIEIFNQYAENAFRVEAGCVNPPTPKFPLKEMMKVMPPGTDIDRAVDHFIKDHLVLPEKMEEARQQFEKLYNSGVFLFETEVKPMPMMGVLVVLRLLVWDGMNHVDANTLLADEENVPVYEEDDQNDFPIE